MLSVNEINFLQAQNEGLKNQNKTLQKTVLNFTNTINKIYNICDEQANDIKVIDLQNKIKLIIQQDKIEI